MAKTVSLARALSKFGVCSRKQAAWVIEAGRVSVDGRVVRRGEHRLDPARSQVRVDGRAVGDHTGRLTLALHKPVGYITSRGDPGGRATVYDLLGDVGRWVFPVGRLDRDSSGLLILTNDHRLGQRLTDPAAHLPKAYHVRVRGAPGPEALRVLREGAPLGRGEVARPAEVRLLGSARGGGTWLEVVLTEGKNRQVRRMCAGIGHEVEDLVRVRVGGLELGDLAPREWRRLGPAEIRRLLQGA
ncbi:MAG TPA: pseudouridine synthase [Vicinamibacteria bacterium]